MTQPAISHGSDSSARHASAILASNDGYCVICEHATVFDVTDPWLRDHYRCRTCRTIPRNRALVNALNRFVPAWRDADLHESSPGGQLSTFLRRSCRRYSSSHCFHGVPRGQHVGEHRSEDLSRLTFPDASFDVLCTSDVFEHVIEPERAFAEVARVLRPGGVHVFTVPWYPSLATSEVRARLNADGAIVHLMEPVYHGNPLSANGSLVTRDWGRDLVDVIYRNSGMQTTMYLERDRSKGLDAELLEVFISARASPAPVSAS